MYNEGTSFLGLDIKILYRPRLATNYAIIRVRNEREMNAK